MERNLKKVLNFFKPKKIKIIIFFILLIISLGFLLFGFLSLSMPIGKEEGFKLLFKRYCYKFGGSPKPTLFVPSFISSIFNFIWFIFFGKICKALLLFLLNTFYLYVLSCLMVFVYEKIEPWKIEKKLLNWLFIVFGIIIAIIGIFRFGDTYYYPSKAISLVILLVGIIMIIVCWLLNPKNKK